MPISKYHRHYVFVNAPDTVKTFLIYAIGNVFDNNTVWSELRSDDSWTATTTGRKPYRKVNHGTQDSLVLWFNDNIVKKAEKRMEPTQKLTNDWYDEYLRARDKAVDIPTLNPTKKTKEP